MFGRIKLEHMFCYSEGLTDANQHVKYDFLRECNNSDYAFVFMATDCATARRG